MPIEIMELVIRARVSDQSDNTQIDTSVDASGHHADTVALEEAVRQAVEIIKRKNER